MIGYSKVVSGLKGHPRRSGLSIVENRRLRPFPPCVAVAILGEITNNASNENLWIMCNTIVRLKWKKLKSETNLFETDKEKRRKERNTILLWIGDVINYFNVPLNLWIKLGTLLVTETLCIKSYPFLFVLAPYLFLLQPLFCIQEMQHNLYMNKVWTFNHVIYWYHLLMSQHTFWLLFKPIFNVKSSESSTLLFWYNHYNKILTKTL